MDKYSIKPLDVYAFLQQQWNLDTIYHANTLATSCTYFANRQIMSRAAVETNGFWQTPQMSDDIDKTYGIWNDIFFDSVDICQRSSIPNAYGPILFGLSTELFKDPSVKSVKITRFNPTKWAGIPETDRYFEANAFHTMIYGDFDHMITLQCAHGRLHLPVYLKTILIDSPDLPVFGGLDIYSYCRGAIRYAMFNPSDYRYIISKRMTGPALTQQYHNLASSELLKRFQIPGVPI